jgi:Cys-tRNA(Pro)/Cys-tRNA(Cys) deacylase
MTPAIDALENAGISYQLHPYKADAKDDGYGLAAAHALGVDPDDLYKTLLVADEQNASRMAVAVIPVSQQLNLKQTAKALGWKKVTMANKQKAQVATGYVLGGISPLGQKQALPILFDQSIEDKATIYFSAGKRGLQVQVAPNPVLELLSARIASLTS